MISKAECIPGRMAKGKKNKGWVAWEINHDHRRNGESPESIQ